MVALLKGILVENFKSYKKQQWIEMSDLSMFMGANSSGKSSVLQALLALKQTVECSSPDIDLLLSGKYVTLGEFKDIANDKEKGYICIGVSLDLKNEIENSEASDSFIWRFEVDNSQNGKLLLASIECKINGCKLKLSQVDDHKYGIDIEGRPTSLLVDIFNLQMGQVYIEYDPDLNLLFHGFLNELIVILTKKKKVTSILKNEMIALYGVDEFFRLVSRDMQIIIGAEVEDEQARSITDRIIQLIDKYAKEQFQEYERFEMFPEFIKHSFLVMAVYRCVQNTAEKEKLESIIEKYERALEEYEEPRGRYPVRNFSELETSYFNLQGSGDRTDDADMDKVSEIFIIYREVLREVLGRIFYVGPIREKPMGLYNIGFESVPKYVGITGGYFASVLMHENKEKEYLLPNDEMEETNLWDALAAWTLHLNVASGIQVDQRNSFGISVSIESTQNQEADIMNVGIGTSQVLPVLIMGLLSEENEVLIFEQPELHLHPYSQSRLADFFVALAKNKRKVIIETHSEYMILRLRYHILTGHIADEKIRISFFRNNMGTEVRTAVIGSYGNIEYPDDFKDETQELLNDLLNAAVARGKQNETECTD